MIETIITKVNAFLTKLYPSFLEGHVPVDKFMHFVGGFLIALILTPFIGGASIIVVALAAAAKEAYDYANKDIHTPDLMDWVATLIGGVLGSVLL